MAPTLENALCWHLHYQCREVYYGMCFLAIVWLVPWCPPFLVTWSVASHHQSGEGMNNNKL